MEKNRLDSIAFVSFTAKKIAAGLLTVLLVLVTAAEAGNRPGCTEGLQGGEALLVRAPSGRALFAKDENAVCVPASTLKVVTALVAIHELGMAHRFPTDVFLDRDQNLIVKGYGDPLLTSEVLAEMARRVAGVVSRFNDLVLDDSYFAEGIRIDGRSSTTNPYDAPVGALCANFNTVYFKRDEQGRAVSAEPETPLIPYSVKRIQSLGVAEGRLTFTQERAEATSYAGHLLLHFLEEQGCRMSGRVRRGRAGEDDDRILRFTSVHALDSVLRGMLEYSNNFMANQLFLAMGAHRYGPPATVEKGILVFEAYAVEMLRLGGFRIVEGSGLSRENRISPRDMMTVLEVFKPYRDLLRKEPGLFFKTGTLSGVTNLAGYIEGTGGSLFSFAIYLGPSGKRMDAIVDCIRRNLPSRSAPGS